MKGPTGTGWSTGRYSTRSCHPNVKPTIESDVDYWPTCTRRGRLKSTQLGRSIRFIMCDRFHITPAARVAELSDENSCAIRTTIRGFPVTDLIYCFLLLLALTRGRKSTNLLLIVRESCLGGSVSGAAKSSSRASNTTRYPMEERRLLM